MNCESNLTDAQWRLINYLNFKIECIVEQEENPLGLDYHKAVRHRDELLKLQEAKVEELKGVMPKVPVYAVKSKPKITHKKDGTLSANGEKWFALLKEKGLKATHTADVTVISGYKEPNPNSSDQKKDWLYSLGWEPETFKYVRDKETGDERKIPQISKDDGLCPSVLALKEKAPEVEVLEGLSVLQHRLGIFQGFIDCAVEVSESCSKCHGSGCEYEDRVTGERHKCSECEGFGSLSSHRIVASVGGLTNTLRFKHRKPIVNLPKASPDVPWGEEVRGCLVSPKGHKLCGSDMVSLEDLTKRHYMQPLDPDYVEAMSLPGYDPHLDLAVFSGAATPEEVEQHKAGVISLKTIRHKYKTTNYSAVYGIGPPKLARELSISLKDAKALLEAYWQRNWSVKKVAELQYVKTLSNGEMWLKNPVSGFYHNLRYLKDIFSTLNQSTGVYCFDRWVAHCRKAGVRLSLQYHDEIGSLVVDGQEARTEAILRQAIAKVNATLKLNVQLDIDVKFGSDYAETH